MANRYWVGGTATWDNTAGTKWALTSGGAGGQAVPTSSDVVFFDAVSGANTVTLGINPTVFSVNCTGFTGTLAFGTQNITCVGTSANQFTGVATMTVTGTPVVNINNATSGTIGVSTGTVTEANAISFNIISGTGTATIGYTKNLNFTGFAGTLANSTKNIYGNLTISSGMTLTAGTNVVSFVASSGTQTIATNGNATIDFPIVLGTSTSINTVQLQDALTVGATRTVTLTGGTLDLNSKTLTTGLFNASGSNTRSILFGTGNITLIGSGTTIWNSATATNFTYTGTPTINCTYSGSTGTRSLTAHGTTGGTETNALSFNVSAGTDIVNGTMVCKNFNLTGFSGTLSNNTKTIYGNLTISSGLTCTAGSLVTTFASTSGTQLITTNGNTTIDFPITFSGTSTYQLQDALTIGSTRTATLTTGTLDLNGKTLSTGLVSSSVSSVRTIAFNAGNITLTGNNATIWNFATATGFTYTGTPTVNCTYSGATGTRVISNGHSVGGTETNAVSFNITAGTDTLQLSSSITNSILNINFTGFAGTFTNFIRTIYGSLTLSSGMILSSGTNATYFSATSGTQQVTTNGKTLDFPITQNGVGGTVQLQDAFTMGATRTYSLINGTFDSNSQTISGISVLAANGGAAGLKGVFNIPLQQTTSDVTLYANTTTSTYTLDSGTLNLNGFNLTCSTQFSTNNISTRSINFASYGKIILSGAGTVWDATNITGFTSSGSGNISFTSASPKTFIGGGGVYRGISQDGTGTLTLTGANTFTTIANTVQPTTVTFPASTITSVNNFTLSGTAGNLVTINSSIPGTQFTLAQI